MFGKELLVSIVRAIKRKNGGKSSESYLTRFRMKLKGRLLYLVLGGILWLVVLPLHAKAATQSIFGESCVIYQPNISLEVQKKQAFILAKQNAIEKAGFYVRSFSKTQNYVLLENDILPVASELTHIYTVKYCMGLDINGVKTLKVIIRAEFDDTKLNDFRQNNIAIYVKKYDELQQQYGEMIKKDQAINVMLRSYELYELGNKQLIKKEYEKALSSYREAAYINPKLTQAIVGIGNVYLHQCNFKLALYEFNQVLTTDSRDVAALYGKAKTLSGMGDYRSAIIQYNIILTLNDQYGPAYQGRGEVKQRIGMMEQAKQDFCIAENILLNQEIGD